MIGNFFHIIFFKPLYNGLIVLIKFLPFNDLGLAIIVLTLVVRFVLFPLGHKAVKTQRSIKQIEPEITKIKETFKKDRQEQTRRIMELYKAHGISPFSGFLTLFIQLPVFIALFLVLREGVVFKPEFLYSFVQLPESVNTLFVGLIELAKPSYVIAILAGLSQFFQIKMSMPKISKKNDSGKRSFGADLQKSLALQMKYVMPVLIVFIAMRFPSGLALYWTTSNIFAIVHETFVSKKAGKILDKNDYKRNKSNNKNNDSRDVEQVNCCG